MRRFAGVIGVVGIAAAALLYARFPPSSSSAGPDDPLPTVRATRGALAVTTVALGTVEPKVGAEVKVGSRLSGVVAELNVGIGDVVEEGDLLALLDDRQWRARVDAIEAELAEANAKLDYARIELEALQAVPDVAAIDRANGRKEVAVLEAAVERVRARLTEARIQLGYTRIAAPVSGTIASVSTYEGETVAASFAAPTFVTIIDLQRLEIHAYVDETDIGGVHSGQPASFRVDAYPGGELRGVVRTIYPKAELVNNVVNYVAVIDIVDAAHIVLRPEMTAHVSFTLAQRDNALTIPRSALLREDGASYVITKSAAGWSKTPVQTGLLTPQRIEVTSGLTEGAVLAADARRWREIQIIQTGAFQ